MTAYHVRSSASMPWQVERGQISTGYAMVKEVLNWFQVDPSRAMEESCCLRVAEKP